MRRVFHPFLLSLYFPVALYTFNIRFVSALELLIPWAVLLSFTGIIWWIASRKVKDLSLIHI